MENYSLKWVVRGPGSAEVVWRFSEEVVKISTTYVGDGLGSLLQAVIDLRGGSSSAIAFLPAEPGGTCLFFAGADRDVYLQIVHFSDMESNRWSGGSLCWHGRISVEGLVRQVVRMADEVLAEFGDAAAYASAWGGSEFPSQKLDTLHVLCGRNG